MLAQIGKRRRRFAQGVFFQRLADERISLEQRLSFLPAMAHFIMSFGDLNRYVLGYPAAENALEQAINEHTAEDANHWPWYIEDLRTLGFDVPTSRAAALLETWSQETSAARQLSYKLIALTAGRSAQERLAIIEVMEETGNAVFSALAPLAARWQQQYDKPLRFCGQHHLSRESGHTLSLDHREMAAIALDESTREGLLNAVDEAFDAFEIFLIECHDYAVQREARHRQEQPTASA